MKLHLILLIFIFFYGCSFDNKSGIWKSETNIEKNKENNFSQFKDLNTSRNFFNKEINIKDEFNFKLPETFSNAEWLDIFFNKYNNSKNFKFNSLNRKSFQSKRITKHKINDNIFFEDDNVISTDYAGNIIIYSLSKKRIIIKFNFYKKKFKKNIKKLNLIIEDNIIYVSDNLGYLYSFDYYKNKVLWAKNFKVPFRSNLKILENQLILSNQNNHLYYVNKNNGNILKFIPTEETLVKNKFINNILTDGNSTFFLNTFGSLYSIDNQKMQINWFINLNENLNNDLSNLFSGNKLIYFNNKIVVTTNNYTYIINSDTGSIIFKKNFSSFIKPFIINNYLFLISKNNLLISFDLNNGEIIYSHNINNQISKFLEINKKNAEFKNIFMMNDKIYIFLKNSYLLIYKINGNLDNIIKLPIKLNSQPIIIRDSIIFLNLKNKVSIIN
mgnify:CR=1 FL=1|tara:strand:+ start:161 stop:1486 length:1326 start_codon:yes stop_codon:yes gene_type:complete